jgi:hypothetical protein
MSQKRFVARPQANGPIKPADNQQMLYAMALLAR